jgi:hypothetical protein
MGWQALVGATSIVAGHLARGQTNFVRSLWKFGSQYDAQKLVRDHREETRYPIALPERKADKVHARELYILRPELVGAAMATDRDRLGFADKGQGGG